MFTVVKHTYFKGVALKDLVPCATALLKFCRHLGSSELDYYDIFCCLN